MTLLHLSGGVSNPPRTENHFIFEKKNYFKVIVKFYVVYQGWSKLIVIEYFIYLNN